MTKAPPDCGASENQQIGTNDWRAAMQSTEQRTCSFDDCEKPRQVFGHCSGHYQQIKQGRTLKPLRKMALRDWSLAERLDSYTDKSARCWIWTGSANTRGYGHVSIGGKVLRAHRVAYELYCGPIKEGMLIDHICHTPACVNPAHLRMVTPKQNGENRAGAPLNSASGVLGVYWNKAAQKWHGRIGHNGRKVHVGYFAMLEDAERAVVQMRNELFTHNDRDRVGGSRA